MPPRRAATSEITIRKRKAVTKPDSFGSEVPTTVAAMRLPQTWLPIDPPMVRILAFMPLATPV